LEGLPFADDTFDAVVCFEAIEHVADPSCVLDEFRRVLRPEGVLLISSPNRGVYPPGNRFHIHEYRPRELEEALARRFANVRLYQQRSHYTSLISDGSKPSRARSEPNPAPDVQMLPSRSEPEETYVVAVAGDGALPELEPLLLVGGTFDGRSWHDLAWSWQERILMAEAAAAASDIDAAAARHESSSHACPSVVWRVVQRLWSGVVRRQGRGA
jgi:SAM-dependent methyltransferase